jgi:hypothetical protein
MFGKRSIQKHGRQAEAVVVASDMSGYSNGHGIHKYHLKLRVQLAEGATVDAKCNAYPTGPVRGFIVGEIVPVRYDPDDPEAVEVDRDAMVAASQAKRKAGEEGLLRLGEERLARGGD